MRWCLYYSLWILRCSKATVSYCSKALHSCYKTRHGSYMKWLSRRFTNFHIREPSGLCLCWRHSHSGAPHRSHPAPLGNRDGETKAATLHKSVGINTDRLFGFLFFFFFHLPSASSIARRMVFVIVVPQRIFILKFLLTIEAEMVVQAFSVVQMEVGFRFEELLRGETSNK